MTSNGCIGCISYSSARYWRPFANDLPPNARSRRTPFFFCTALSTGVTPMKIEQIKIAGLFAKYDANLTVRDNTIILVGANGLGKSTILNIVHYTLTKQWDLLPTLPFRSVTIEINGRELTLHADYLSSSSIFSANQENLQSRSPQRFRANLHSLLSYSP